TCTITDISSETVTSTITCSTPTLSACPDNEQVPDDCDKCEQTTTVTCIPTSTVCAPICLPVGTACEFDNQCCTSIFNNLNI
ncbi:9123_t:CDS:2, partial [Gigaspora rosea]